VSARVAWTSTVEAVRRQGARGGAAVGEAPVVTSLPLNKDG
jgi:hypothetical protein